jgi:hypothetical protein
MLKQKRFLSLVVVGALAIVGVFGAFAYRTVSAQTPTTTPAAPDAYPAAPPTQKGTTPPARPGHDKGPWGNVQGTNPDQQLADALGITLEKLQAAETTANADALKEAVAQGLLTQAQADQLSANAANRPHFGEFDRFGANSGIDYNALLAKALGITTDQLQTARQKVQDDNLAAAVTSGAMTQAQADLIKAREALANNSAFQANLKSAYEAALKQAVTDSTITQAQADAILADQAAKPGFPGLPGFGPGRGFDGGFGGPGGHRGGPGLPGGPNNGTNQTNPASPTPTAPSSSNGV